MAKVIIYLREHEVAALNSLAEREYRAPRAQAALIIRNELQRLGLIPSRVPGDEGTASAPALEQPSVLGTSTVSEG